MERFFFIASLVWKYGPVIWDIGMTIYKLVEKIANDKGWKKKAKDERIALKHESYSGHLDAAIASEGIALTAATAEQLRQDVWVSRKDNWKKTRGKTRGARRKR